MDMASSSKVKKRPAILKALWVVCGLGVAAVSAQADSLGDALTGAYNHSGILDQNRALLRAADEDVAQATSALLPIINWTASATQSYSRSNSGVAGVGTRSTNALDVQTGLNLQLLLSDGGGAKTGVEAAKETVLATRASLLSVEQQILLRAVQAFMNVRSASEFVALRQNNVRLITQELRAARDRFEVGDITRTDVALAEARLAEARAGLASAEGDLAIAQEEYRNVVGHRPGALRVPPNLPRLPGDVRAAEGEAVRLHPDLRAAQHRVAASELVIQQARAAMKPRVTLQGNVGLSNRFDSDAFGEDVSVGVQMNQPIYQGGALSSQVRQAQARRDAERGALHTVRHDIRQNVGVAYAQLAVARASLEASERQIRAARTAFRGVREEATLGARTTLDVLDAEQELLNAQAARISAQAQEQIAAYAVLAALGKLTAEQLKLPVQLYDVAAYYNMVKNAPAARSRQGRQLDRVLRALGEE